MRTRDIGRALLRGWAIALAAMVIGAGLGFLWAERQPQHYEAESSYIVRAAVDDVSNIVRATVTLTASDQIMETYVGIATSDVVAGRAHAELGISEGDRSSLEAASRTLPGTNVILIGARGPDPELALAMARRVGRLTEEYVADLNDVFVLVALDPATLPAEPSGPSPVAASVIGGMMALVGALAALALVEYRHPRPWHRRQLRSIFDPETHAYSSRYLGRRLREEVARSQYSGQPFSVGLLEPVRRGRPDAEGEEEFAAITLSETDALAASIEATLRPQDMLGHLGQGRFAAILPGVGLDQAQQVVARWRRATTLLLLDGHLDRDIVVRSAACQYDSPLFVGDAEAEQLVNSL